LCGKVGRVEGKVVQIGRHQQGCGGACYGKTSFRAWGVDRCRGVTHAKPRKRGKLKTLENLSFGVGKRVGGGMFCARRG